MLGFGISFKSLLFPQQELNFKEVFKIFKISFWVIIGDVSLLELLNSELDCDENCSNNRAAIVVSYFVLVLYVILLPVLIINLLIATLR